jgi:endonuclease III
MNPSKAVRQLKALRRLVRGREPRLAAEQSAKWKILISTILASQSRDILTNKISEILYKKYKSPKALGNAPLSNIKKIIRPINYYQKNEIIHF